MATEEEKKAKRALRRANIMGLPATYADSFSVIPWSDGVRITFGEYMNEETYYRSAIVMPLGDAERLAKRLIEAIEEEKKAVEEKETEAKTPTEPT